MPKRITRRQFVLGASAGALTGIGSIAIWLSGTPAAIAGLPDWDHALRWIDKLSADRSARTTQGWPLPQVLEHLAQSIEYSIDGYPQPQPAWFQNTLGRIASSAFQRRGHMQHDLQAAIPGAPALNLAEIDAGCTRLRAAIQRFELSSQLQPHFAYGLLDRDAYRRAHLMHLADHARWIQPGPEA